jgi:hypothetical protein
MYIVLGQPLLDSGIHDSLLSSHFHHFRDGFWGIDELWADQGAKAFWAHRELARPLTHWVLIAPLALWVSIGLLAFWAAYVLVILAFTTPDRRGV